MRYSVDKSHLFRHNNPFSSRLLPSQRQLQFQYIKCAFGCLKFNCLNKYPYHNIGTIFLSFAFKKVTSQYEPENMGRLSPKFTAQAIAKPNVPVDIGAKRSWKKLLGRSSSPSNSSSQVAGIFIILESVFWYRCTTKNKSDWWGWTVNVDIFMYARTSVTSVQLVQLMRWLMLFNTDGGIRVSVQKIFEY